MSSKKSVPEVSNKRTTEIRVPRLKPSFQIDKFTQNKRFFTLKIVNGCSDMHDAILSQLKELKAIFLWKIFPYHRNFSPKLIKVPVLLLDTLEYVFGTFWKEGTFI